MKDRIYVSRDLRDSLSSKIGIGMTPGEGKIIVHTPLGHLYFDDVDAVSYFINSTSHCWYTDVRDALGDCLAQLKDELALRTSAPVKELE